MNCYKCATPLPDHSRFCMACGADVSGEGHAHDTVNMEPDPELLAALQTELGTEFVVERELGRGGMAIVYLGQDTSLGRKVAIKLLPPMLTFGSGPGFIERFKREARTAAALDHPHIVPVYRVSTGGKLFWYVMKYLQGESLDLLLKREAPITVDRTIDILEQAADALDYAHQNHVVHRDVKPANIMLDKRGRVTVTDFGIAKALETTGLTNSGATIGTPHYMAPEQCLGVKITGAADQYALGISAYQMLSGKLPFSADSVLELMRMHTVDPPPPLNEIRPELPMGIVAVVEKSLAKAPDNRFATCSDFVSAMSEAWKAVGERAKRPTTPVVEIKTLEAKPAPAPPRRSPLPRTQLESPRKKIGVEKRESRRLLYFCGAAVVVIVAAILIVPKLGRDDVKPPEPIQGRTSSDTSAGQELAMPAPPPVQRESVVTKQPVAAKTQAETTKTVVRPPRNTTTRQAGTPTPPKTQAKAPVIDAPPPAPAHVTVGSRPPSAITINGRAAPSHPATNIEVPPGRVTIRFQVTDSTGVWSVDTVITVAPGEVKNLGRIPLKRP